MILDVGHRRPEGAADQWVERALRWEPPVLPGLSAATVRRWRDLPTWMPPEAAVLCRHRELDGPRRVHSNSRQPPPGCALEFDLGFVRQHGAPGADRLLTGDGLFWIDADEDALPAGVEALGYVEQAPLPMLDVLEVRALPGTGQHVLVAGPDDPLAGSATPVTALGWIESLPVQPRRPLDRSGRWGLRALVRVSDPARWRHTYLVDPPERPAGAVGLGGLWHARARGFVPLHTGPDGRLRSPLAQPRGVAGSWRESVRWVGAPLSWSSRPRPWALRATASRVRHAVRQPRSAGDGTGGAPLGWLRAAPARGWSPLFSASHPALPDQFVTRSELEAHDLGFHVDGILGYACDDGADRYQHEQPREVLWGSRFGHGRRYVEGPARRA